MKIYGSLLSPFVRHCRIALIQSDFDWQMVEVDNETSAAASPSQKVPYFEDGDVFLTDSASILKYVREKSGMSFFEDINDFELFCRVNTLADATLNLFLLEKDDIAVGQSAYLVRQQSRIDSALNSLNQLTFDDNNWRDGKLRLACYIDWALFRQRINIESLANLKSLLSSASNVQGFDETNPYDVVA